MVSSPLFFVQMARTVVVVGAFRGLMGERLLSNNLTFHEKKGIYCAKSNFCSQKNLYALTICRTEDVYIYTPLPRHLDRENYLPLFTQAAELDLFFLLLFFFFVPSLPVPFDFPLSSAPARST